VEIEHPDIKLGMISYLGFPIAEQSFYCNSVTTICAAQYLLV
jgi:hypothetical protein